MDIFANKRFRSTDWYRLDEDFFDFDSDMNFGCVRALKNSANPFEDDYTLVFAAPGRNSDDDLDGMWSIACETISPMQIPLRDITFFAGAFDCDTLLEFKRTFPYDWSLALSALYLRNRIVDPDYTFTKCPSASIARNMVGCLMQTRVPEDCIPDTEPTKGAYSLTGESRDMEGAKDSLAFRAEVQDAPHRNQEKEME